MGLLVGLLAVAVALARVSLVGRLRAALPWVGRASGVLLVLAGAYVAWYGWYEIRVLGGGSTSDAVVDRALAVQSQLAAAVDRVGPVWLAVGLAVVLAGGVLVRGRVRR
jgi:hypothetical protein